MDEQVLCIPTKKLYGKGRWNGFRRSRLEWYRQLVEQKREFRLRDAVETDPSWKQVIPQILFVHSKRIFLHKISKTASESRLHGQYEMFLGGHVNPMDHREGQDLLDTAAQREFDEEVQYRGSFIRKQFIGVINRLSARMVDRVHLGFLYLYEGKSAKIVSRETKIEEVGLLSVGELKPFVPQMTFWSQTVYPYLEKLI